MEFDLQKYCSDNKYDFHKVHLWLMLDYKRTTFFTPFECRRLERSKIKASIEKGATVNFDLLKIMRPKLFLLNQYLDESIEKYDQVLEADNKEIEFYENKITQLNNAIRILEIEIANPTIQKEEKKLKVNELNLYKFKLDVTNKEILVIDNIKAKNEQIKYDVEYLRNYASTIRRVITDIDEVSHKKSNVSKKYNPILNPAPAKVLVPTFFDWPQINFGDGQIWLLKDGRPVYSFPYLKSKRSFNKLKDLYTKRNYPPLKVIVSNGKIIKIENIQLLDYLFHFLVQSSNDIKIDDHFNSLVKKYKSFPKKFYKSNFKKMLSTNFFSFLIDTCSEQYPIIPLPEMVRTRSGVESIDDSFIFPLAKKNRILWVWESVEESKATYCFETSKNDFEEELQPVFNFLTSKIENKRQMLTRKVSINGVKPILKLTHRNFSQWKTELNSILF